VSDTLPAAEQASVVLAIATRDGRHLLEGMLPSVAAQRFRDFRVVVVDDGSRDGTPDWLAAHWPQVEVIALPRSVGVTAAFNVCIATAGGAELLALFNNDMELDPDCVGELVEALRRYPAAGFATAKLMNFHDRRMLDGAGDVFDWNGTAWRRAHGELDRGQYDAPEPIFGACGGAALYRRTALDAVGLFYEPFFAFLEDVDWSFRARLAGIGCRYVPTAVAFHMGSATLGAGMTDFTRYHLTRNAIWLVLRDYPLSAFARWLPRLMRGQIGAMRDARRHDQLRVWLRAWRDALRGAPAALRDRRAVQRCRRVGRAALEAAIAEGHKRSP
jgi:GT2 family glycosyltransferase